MNKMDATRLDVKLYADGSSRFELAELIPVFHGWIQRSVIDDELLIDVADYSHVVDGPGVVLVGHEAQYAIEQMKGRTGLLYSQRRARVNGFAEALSYSLKHALRAASLLLAEDKLKGKLGFRGDELTLRINDRLRAPNTEATFREVEPLVRGALGKLFDGAKLELSPGEAGGELFTIHVKSDKSVSVNELLARVS